jgi:hypothetical protein
MESVIENSNGAIAIPIELTIFGFVRNYDGIGVLDTLYICSTKLAIKWCESIASKTILELSNDLVGL